MPLVGLEAQSLIGVDGVEALVLEAIGSQLVDQADAAALLRQIEQHAAARFFDGVDGAAQLLAAIAFERAQEVAGEARRMQPRQDGLGRRRRVDDDGVVLGAAVLRPERDEFGLLRALERHARAGHDLQGTDDFGVVAEDVGGTKRHCVHRGASRGRHDGRRQQIRELGELDRRGIAERQGFAQRVERTFERVAKIVRRIGDGAQLVGVQVPGHRQRDDFGRVDADLERAGARVAEHQPCVLGRPQRRKHGRGQGFERPRQHRPARALDRDGAAAAECVDRQDHAIHGGRLALCRGFNRRHFVSTYTRTPKPGRL